MRTRPAFCLRPFLFSRLPLLALAGCGFGTAAVVGASRGGGGANGKSVASSLQVPRSSTSPASVRFVMTDQEGDAADVEILFRTASNSNFQPITLAAGSAPLTGLPSASAPYRVEWDFAADLGGLGYRNDIEIQLVVKGGISPDVLTGVAQGNDAPRVLSPAAAWKVARPAETLGTEPTPEFALVNVETTAAGRVAGFRWDTLADLDGFDDDVKVRLTPADEYSTGPPVATQPFRIDNNALPQAILESDCFVLGTKDRGNIPIPFSLVDEESDAPRVLVQWRAAGTAWPTLPPTAALLRDLLDGLGEHWGVAMDPLDERKQQQTDTVLRWPVITRSQIEFASTSRSSTA